MSCVLVTGAARGLGLALCRILAARGDAVIATCRRPSPEIEALGVEILPGIDLAEETSIAQLRDGLGGRRIDVVICNAGVNFSYAAGIEELDLAVLRAEFEVNTFGVVRTVKAALPSLDAGAKIALISTWRPGAGAASRNYGYQMSKVATNQLSFLLADELAPRGISTILLSPGPMETELLQRVVASGHANLRPGQASDPHEVAGDLLKRIDELTPQDSGAWRFRGGESMGAIATSVVYGH
jgi:NAD(P)-dependent dehydrogenase (short-subunit alcohol dehydrogenase family)